MPRSPVAPVAERLVLASGSPRRRELLASLGLTFEVCAADIDETEFDGEDPRAYVIRLARSKALHVASTCAPGTVVVGADTTVSHRGSILGKPEDAAGSRVMLARLSGQTHDVFTGMAVAIAGVIDDPWTYVSATAVTIADLDDATIEWYIGTGEPFDKAGGYGIQGIGGALVASVHGNVQNVIGLPLADLLRNPTIAAAARR